MRVVSPNNRNYWKCVTEQIEINSLYRGVFSTFFVILCIIMQKKPSTFPKLGDFSLQYQNLSKFSAPLAPKLCHLIQFIPNIFKSSHFWRLLRRKMYHWTAKTAPCLVVSPLQFDPWLIFMAQMELSKTLNHIWCLLLVDHFWVFETSIFKSVELKVSIGYFFLRMIADFRKGVNLNDTLDKYDFFLVEKLGKVRVNLTPAFLLEKTSS